jgi:hypothetical protein
MILIILLILLIVSLFFYFKDRGIFNMFDGKTEEKDLAGDIVLTVYYPENVMSGVYNQYPNLNYSLMEYYVSNIGSKPITLTFTSEIQDYTLQSVDALVVNPNDEVQILKQHPTISPSVDLKEITNANLHYRVSIGAEVVEEKTIPIRLYAKDTMIWATKVGDKWIDDSYLIAAWVTPHAKGVDSLIRQAADYHPDKSIDGYQCSSCITYEDWKDYTGMQVEAIYDALKYDYKVTYVNAGVAYSSKDEAPQRIKLPKDSLTYSSANCIDGSVLFASALESIEIDPILVLTTNHAFLCWYVSPDTYDIDCVETTMINSYDYKIAEEYGLSEYYGEMDNGNFDNNLSTTVTIKISREFNILPMT